jgi:hypothetical protein
MWILFVQVSQHIFAERGPLPSALLKGISSSARAYSSCQLAASSSLLTMAR